MNVLHELFVYMCTAVLFLHTLKCSSYANEAQQELKSPVFFLALSLSLSLSLSLVCVCVCVCVCARASAKTGYKSKFIH